MVLSERNLKINKLIINLNKTPNTFIKGKTPAKKILFMDFIVKIKPDLECNVPNQVLLI